MKLAKLRSGMRRVAGVEVPRQDRTSVAFKKAQAAAGEAPDAGVADGSPARMRTDRPGRARGGRICREDGGKTVQDDSGTAESTQKSYLEKEAQKSRDEASKARTGRNVMGGSSGVLGVLGSVGNKMQRKGNWPLALLNGAMAVGEHFTAKNADAKADKLENEASKFKRGGAVKKRADGGGNWIKGATQNKGALHRALRVPMGEKIPEKKLEKAEHSDNPKMAKRAQLAETLKGLHK